MKKENKKQKEPMSDKIEAGALWREIQEQQAWDDFLAWCREQENSPHE